MKIFLDENLPRKLVDVLRAEGHEVESVHTLHLQGLANGYFLLYIPTLLLLWVLWFVPLRDWRALGAIALAGAIVIGFYGAWFGIRSL